MYNTEGGLTTIEQNLKSKYPWIKSFEFDSRNNVVIGYGERILYRKMFVIHDIHSGSTNLYEDIYYDYHGSEDCTTVKIT
jgi:hypothetical protein